MENNNNNGRGIFYGVIGVATLVVAIIGATFAYFSASITQNDAINVASAEIKLEIINQKTNFKTDMIPVDTVNKDGEAVTAFYTFPGLTASGTGAGTCVDLVGNSICSVYEFTIKNPSATTSQTVVGSMTVTANSGFTNLKYALFKGAAAEITSYNVNANIAENLDASTATAGTLMYVGTIGNANSTDEWDSTEELLGTTADTNTTTYTVVVWLEDSGSAQDSEQKQTFASSITFTSDNGQGVTGVLTSSS